VEATTYDMERNIRTYAAILLGVLTLMTAGCIPTPPTSERAIVQNDLVQLAEGQQAIEQRLQKFQDNLILLEAKIQDQQEVIEELKSVQAAMKGATSGGRPLFSGEGSTGETTATADSSKNSPTEIYLKAFSDYASGRYQSAVSGFETFLRLYPANDYAANAFYWLGESYSSLKNYALAAEAYARIADRFPDWSKTPEALLKAATALTQMNRNDEANAVIQMLREKYPKSSAAEKSYEDGRFSAEPQP